MRCPRCGNKIPDFAEGNCYVCQNAAAKNGGKPVPSAASKFMPKQSSSPKDRISSGVQKRVSASNTTLRLQRYGINNLLHDIYGIPISPSVIFTRKGLSSQEIGLVRKNIQGFVDALLPRLDVWIRKNFPVEAARLVIHHYGLDGKPPRDLRTLSFDYGLTERQIEKLKGNLLNLLTQEPYSAEFEALFIEAAKVAR
jgi:hypothetical protein